jgi:tetratricopeptide (TPR) repeat protein
MAKTCNDCHRTYPDNLKACPHCAKARAEDSSVIRLHDPNATLEWQGDPSSSSHNRSDVITIDPEVEMPAGSPEDSSVEVLPDKGGVPGQPVKKKTQLAPKGRETKLHGPPPDEADLGGKPKKPSDRSAPETMIANRGKVSSPPSGGSSDDIRLDDKSGSSTELKRQKKEGSSVEISLEKEKSGSSVEINLDSDSSVELDRKKKGGSSVERRGGSSAEINLDEEGHGPDSSLLLGGPASHSGSSGKVGISAIEEKGESGESAVDLGSSLEVRLDEESREAAESDSSVATEEQEDEVVATAAQPSRPSKKRGSSTGLLLAGGIGLLVASLVWIFGPLDGLRGSLRETFGLSTEKKAQAQMPGSLRQIGMQLPAAKQDDEEKPTDRPDQTGKPDPESSKDTKPAKIEESKDTSKPAPAPINQPVEKKPETPPATPAIVAAPAPDKNLVTIAIIAEAAKLAKDQKYKDASAALQKAQGASNDDGIRRFCEELQASWQIREKLGSAGYLTQQKDPMQALDALLKDKKDSSAVISAALEKMKAGKDVSLSQALDSLLESTKKSDEQVKTLQSGKAKLEKEKEDAQTVLTAASSLLKEGKYVDEKSPNLTQGVEKLIADKKNSDTQAKEASAKLKDAEETIQDMTKKLIDPKSAPQGQGPAISTSAKISPPDITVAEKYYSSGLAHFWSGDYSVAEKDFATAIRFYKDDARFFYYFGLCCWNEGKRTEAAEAFQKGYALELQSRPSSPMINSTFERIQGSARKALDREREQPKLTD